MPTAVPRYPSPQEKKSWPYKRSDVSDPLRRKSKMAQCWSCQASTAGISLLCICAWVGMLGTERNMRGVVALPKSSHFSCCGSSFLLLWELIGAVGWSFGRMRQICCSQNSSCIGFLGMVKQMQMSEIAKRIPWNCTIKSNCGLKEKKETLQTVFTHVFPLNPHQ